jgi:thioredoxin-dependent peroxiredoxin
LEKVASGAEPLLPSLVDPRFFFFRAYLRKILLAPTCAAMTLRPVLFTAALSAFLAMFFSTTQAEPLKVGDPAPAVTGITETGATLALADVYKQQPYTLVYFYPKADTPGCTKQGCSLRDAYEELMKKGVAVIGVSRDDPAAQKAFKEKYHLPFTLVADPDKTVINAFGVPTRVVPAMGEFASRSAYLIKDGKIIYTDYKGTTDKQAETILKVIAEQKS